jgi:two-component system, NtrC family, response regulator AtoC
MGNVPEEFVEPEITSKVTKLPPLEGGTLGDEIEAIERQRIIDAVEECGGNQSRAAKMLGISRNTLASRLDQYGIKRPRKP